MIDTAGQQGTRPFFPIQSGGVTQGDVLPELQALCHSSYELIIKSLFDN
jgi:hypothetical protein